ncbi:MAG TPA: hypothetical protein VKY59_21360, partial [Spirillospora sp.]|nr:hypothetical protein [Spirillospora sp.]
MTYLGLPVLVLAGIAVVSAPRKHPFWLIAAGLATFYALGQSSPFWSLLVDALPFLRWFRVPSRAWFVVVMVACLLAGYGLQVLSGTVARLRQNGEVRGLAIMRLALAGIMGASLLCGAMTLAFLPSLPQTIGLGVMGVGLLLGTTLLLAFYNQISPQRLAAMLALVLFIDLAWTGRNWLEWRGPEQWLTHQQTLVDAVQAENPARIYSPNYALEQQVAAANELRLFYGVDPFQLAGIVDAIEQGSGVPVMEYTVVLPPLNLEPVASDDRSPDERLRTANRDAAPDTAVLAEWGVSHVIATYPIEHERLLLAREVDGTFIYANLDFDPQTIFSESGWPLSGWPDLPDVATVADLNRMTAVSALIAGISFVLCVVFVFRGLLHR